VQVHLLLLDKYLDKEGCREVARSLPGLACLCYVIWVWAPPTQKRLRLLLRKLDAFAAHCGRLRQLRFRVDTPIPQLRAAWRRALRKHRLVQSWASARQLHCFVDRGDFPDPLFS